VIAVVFVIAALTGSTGFCAGRWDREHRRYMTAVSVVRQLVREFLPGAGVKRAPGLHSVDGGKR